MRRFIATLVVLLCAVPAFSETPREGMTRLSREAQKAYAAKDWAAFVEKTKQALAFVPGRPVTLYNLACGEALSGNTPEALRILSGLVDRKLDLDYEKESDFDSLHALPGWKALEARLVELRAPVVRSEVAFTLPDRGLLVEGVAYDPATGDFFLASVRRGKVVRRAKDGTVTDFTAEGQDGIQSAIAVAVDAKRRLLWIASAYPGPDEDKKGRSGLWAYDLGTRKLTRKVLAPAESKKTFLNDLAIDSTGTVYSSASDGSGVFRLRSGASTLEMVTPPGAFASPQGMVLSKDEKTLFVADYPDGISAISLATGERRKLADPPGLFLGGIDGLVGYSDGFIATQNGVRPFRVIRLWLDAAGNLAKGEILEKGHPLAIEPTLGVVVGDAFFYNANAQWDLFDEKSGVFAEERAKAPVILKLPLK